MTECHGGPNEPHSLILMFCTLTTGTSGSQWPPAQNKNIQKHAYHHCNAITKAQIRRAYRETKANFIQCIKKQNKKKILQPENNPCTLFNCLSSFDIDTSMHSLLCLSSFDRRYRRHFCAWNVLKYKDYIIFIPVTENIIRDTYIQIHHEYANHPALNESCASGCRCWRLWLVFWGLWVI